MEAVMRKALIAWLVKKAATGRPVVLSPAAALELAQLLTHV